MKYENLLPHIKMGKKILMFGDIEIGKNKFYCYKVLFFIRCRYCKSISI